MGVFGSGGSLQWTVDLQALFQQPAGNFFYAASLQYDYVSGRWFLGGIASNTGAHLSWLLMAVSRSGNPNWAMVRDHDGHHRQQPEPVSAAVPEQRLLHAREHRGHRR